MTEKPRTRALTYKPQIWQTETSDHIRRKQTPVPRVWAVAALDWGGPTALLYEEYDTWGQALNGALHMNYAGL